MFESAKSYQEELETEILENRLGSALSKMTGLATMGGNIGGRQGKTSEATESTSTTNKSGKLF